MASTIGGTGLLVTQLLTIGDQSTHGGLQSSLRRTHAGLKFFTVNVAAGSTSGR